MLSQKERKAVRLMFEMPEEQVAREVGVTMDTLRRWKGKREFGAAVQAVEREARESVGRIILGSLVKAAIGISSFTAANAEGAAGKGDPKVMVDLLKASGLLESALRKTPQEDPLMVVMARLDEMEKAEMESEARNAGG